MSEARRAALNASTRTDRGYLRAQLLFQLDPSRLPDRAEVA
jgi:hypothetical protein